ncbi:homoserine kinase [Candidatus Pelagibacter sp.]|nr:homoserine kinase [Candidatus Pelagibacter sp.]
MAVFTKINTNDIYYIENQFNLGKIKIFKGIKKGIENTNYLIRTKNKKYILTIFEKRIHGGCKYKDLIFFMKLMSKLIKLKIKCPKPVRNKKGTYIFKLKNKNACIVSFLEGKDKKQLSVNDYFSIGKNVAKLHIASKKINLYRKNSLSVNSWGPLLKKVDNRINKLSSNLVNLMKSDLADIKKKWPKKIPKGIIHSDLFIDNIFFYKNKFYGFIDFYFSANDFLAYELATCINALCFKKRNKIFVLDKKKSSQLLKGYQSVRKLSLKEKNNLNTLCRGSALRYLLTRSYDFLNTPKNAIIKIKDPLEYLHKLNLHRNLNSFKDYS